MKELFEKRVNLILATIIVMVALAVAIPSFIISNSPPTQDIVAEKAAKEAAEAETEETEAQTEKSPYDVNYMMVDPKSDRAGEATEATEKLKVKPAQPATEAPTKPTEETESTEPQVFATAAPAAYPASYDAQWDEGYLVAIDNPDHSYSAVHVELSDSNRDLLERLCMGEFGEGGEVGSALIAQAVRDAMNYYGIDDVAEVIKLLHYTGSTRIPASQSCKNAVSFIFDMDESAIQHRILYMYNPKQLSSGFSSFHESQKYVCTFMNVRFFDK